MDRVVSMIAALVCLLVLPTALSARVILYEEFGDGLPPDWLVYDDIPDFQGVIWQDGNPGGRTGWTNLDDTVLIADSAWFADQGFPRDADTSVVSSGVDLTGFSNVMLRFGSDFFNYYNGATYLDDAFVHVRNSTDPNWTEFYHEAENARDELVGVDISSLADDQDGVQLRWQYVADGTDHLWWAIDSVELTGDCFSTDTEDLIGDDGSSETGLGIGSTGSQWVVCERTIGNAVVSERDQSLFRERQPAGQIRYLPRRHRVGLSRRLSRIQLPGR
ncbi:MAG: hypothetical protein M5R36_16125 [Deltaproteobacteria bacterium]|nr:hypothetical protein [Deltaproteobacteria bacterium]